MKQGNITLLTIKNTRRTNYQKWKKLQTHLNQTSPIAKH
jgi:hypothetical protein